LEKKTSGITKCGSFIFWLAKRETIEMKEGFGFYNSKTLKKEFRL